MTEKTPHIPVLLNEVVESIAPKDGGVYVDGTFGAGGYTRAVLDAADCTVYAIDRDPDAIREGQKLIDAYKGRLHLLHGTFGEMAELVRGEGVDFVDGVMLDIGVSSMQIDRAERGFSFQKDGALDMRMSQNGLSAADVLNTFGEREIADIIYKYGEERFSRRIAAAVVEQRKTAPFKTTLEFADLIRRTVPHKREDIDPATRSFQALRIYVNDELGQLESGLSAAHDLLKAGGRMAIVSFHSLEDRIYMPVVEKQAATLKTITKKPILPTESETKFNPRARSARLRVAEKTEG